MGDINTVVLSGRLTRDPEYKATASGTSVLDLGVAVNDRVHNNATGAWEDRANFIDCTVFGKRAGSLSSILRKGMQVSLSGRLRYDSWEDRQTGARRSKVYVVVDEVALPPAQGQQGGQAAYAPQPAYAPQAPQAAQPAYAAPQQAYQAPYQAYQAPQAYQAQQQAYAAAQPAYAQPAPSPQPAQQPAQAPLPYADEDIPF